MHRLTAAILTMLVLGLTGAASGQRPPQPKGPVKEKPQPQPTVYTNPTLVPKPTSSAPAWLATSGPSALFASATLVDLQESSEKSGYMGYASGTTRVYRRFPRVQVTGIKSDYDTLKMSVSYVITEKSDSGWVEERATLRDVKKNGTLVVDFVGIEDQTGERVSGHVSGVTIHSSGGVTYNHEINRTRYSMSTITFVQVRITNAEGDMLFSGKWGKEPPPDVPRPKDDKIVK